MVTWALVAIGLFVTAGCAGDPATKGTGGSDGGAPPPPPKCRLHCETAADCAAEYGSDTEVAVTDEDNWACNEGVCEHLGCNSTAECVESYGDAYACVEVPGIQLPGCFKSCSATPDCGPPDVKGNEIFECVGGRCRPSWCTCVEIDQYPAFTCWTALVGVPSSCERSCSLPLDCRPFSHPLHGDDNYDCVEGRCVYLGCQSSGECSEIGYGEDCR